MTVGAVPLYAIPLKLTAVDVLVASQTRGRRVFERQRFRSLGGHWAMALQAAHGSMRSQQHKLRSRMVERSGLFPGANVVAPLATVLGIGSGVAAMGVFVARDASERREVITRGGRGRLI